MPGSNGSAAGNSGAARRAARRRLMETVLKVVSLALQIVWLLVLLPFGWSILWVSAVVLGILILLLLIFWRRLVLWHSRLEIELQAQLKAALGSTTGLAQALEEPGADWQLQAEEFVVPDFAACAGRSIGQMALRKRFGCSIANIDRQGFVISNPAADTLLYPRDRLLLLGTSSQIDQAARELGVIAAGANAQEIEELSLEVVTVLADSPRGGATLAELDPIRNVGIQIAGIQRASQRTYTPGGDATIHAGDELLVLGTSQRIQEFRDWLHPLPTVSASDHACLSTLCCAD